MANRWCGGPPVKVKDAIAVYPSVGYHFPVIVYYKHIHSMDKLPVPYIREKVWLHDSDFHLHIVLYIPNKYLCKLDGSNIRQMVAVIEVISVKARVFQVIQICQMVFLLEFVCQLIHFC